MSGFGPNMLNFFVRGDENPHTHTHTHTRAYTHTHTHTRAYTHTHTHLAMESLGRSFAGGRARACGVRYEVLGFSRAIAAGRTSHLFISAKGVALGCLNW